MSKIEVNTVAPQCGTTLTLGESGDTVTLGSGASQSGFGRTGTVDWDTTAKTASFTAVSGNGYFVNTTSGAVTVTLPASPSAGDIVAIADYAGTAGTNNITIARNGSNINGSAEDITINKNNSGIFLVYVDATQGWKNTETSNLNDIETQPAFIVACGGTETECGDFKIHTFTGPGTFTVSSLGNSLGSETVDYLIVAGGGGGGSGAVSEGGGGGGAGGFRESSGAASGCYTASPLGACVSALPVAVQGYPITVGGGGPGGNPSGNNSGSGNNSVFSTITSAGGGAAGGQTGSPSPRPGTAGGSGGGAVNGTGGAGNTPSVSPAQGTSGGNSAPGPQADSVYVGSGGGGATAVGASTSVSPGKGCGGAGATSSINGTPTARAGGGGGGFGPSGTAPYGIGAGGAGGGGGGGPGPTSAGNAGTVNTGGGGGGGSSGSSPVVVGGAGGSGIVVIRYKFQ